MDRKHNKSIVPTARMIRKNMTYDAERTAYLEKYGLRVVRFDNIEINKNFDGICEYN